MGAKCGALAARDSLIIDSAVQGSKTFLPLQVPLSYRLMRRLLSHARVSPILQPSRLKVLIRLGQSLFLGSGKATTRAKGRITAALRVLSLRTASPRGHFRGNSTAPLKLAES